MGYHAVELVEQEYHGVGHVVSYLIYLVAIRYWNMLNAAYIL